MISLHGHRFWRGRGGGGVGAVLIPHVRAAVRATQMGVSGVDCGLT